MAKAHGFFDKCTFLCEMYREDAEEIVTLILNFFPYDNSVQVIDTKKGKNLVKRTHAPYLKQEMLEVGNIINVFSRLLYLKDCTDHTRKFFTKNTERNFVLIKPLPAEIQSKIINFISTNGFEIIDLKKARLTKQLALQMYQYIGGTKTMPLIIDYILSGDIVGMELAGPNAIERFRKFLGATDPKHAAPGTIRRIFGTDILKNAVHSSSSSKDAEEMIDIFFGIKDGVPNMPYPSTFENCTCCIIKPHAIHEGQHGAIVEHIATSGKFYISCMRMIIISLNCAKEFYEVYEHVVPEFYDMCLYLSGSRCLALEVKAVDPTVDVVSEFRKFCGPRDPDMCRMLYPNTIRALYGKDTIFNAVHCTDLPEDGVVEVEYIFRLLPNQNYAFRKLRSSDFM